MTTENSTDGCTTKRAASRLWHTGNRPLRHGDRQHRNRGLLHRSSVRPAGPIRVGRLPQPLPLRRLRQYALYTAGGAPLPTIGFKNGLRSGPRPQLRRRPPEVHLFQHGHHGRAQDIYSRFLDCQWVDITDLPGGDYPGHPRQLGLQPRRHPQLRAVLFNNAVAVCFSFERDANGNAVNFTKTEDCPVPVDCIGHPRHRRAGLRRQLPRLPHPGRSGPGR